MFLQNHNRKKILFSAMLVLSCLDIMAQDQPAAKAAETGSNLLAILMVSIAGVLLFVIWGLGQVLITFSRQLLDKRKTGTVATTVLLLIMFSFLSNSLIAQNTTVNEVENAIPNYGGLSSNEFYCLVSVIGTEVLAILFLFFFIRRIYAELKPATAPEIVKKSRWIALWIRLNKKLTKSVPLEKEADALLDHDYDGIRELDNALPPWWKYGFVVTIVFAIVYLLNFHVLGSGKNPTEEYIVEMETAKIQKEEFEARNKDRIDESNVPLADATGIKQGQEFFQANCIACHGSKGEGGAGPNLTDNYWLHKGSLNDIYNTIKKGYPDKGMQSWAVKFNPKEISLLASFVTTLKGTNPPGAKAAQGELYEASANSDSLKTKSLVNR